MFAELAAGKFVVAAELVTSRGLISAATGRGVLETARSLAADARVDVLSITGNPGGNATPAPDTLGTDLVSRGQGVIIRLSGKDWNRNALESRGWKLSSEGPRLALGWQCQPPSGRGGIEPQARHMPVTAGIHNQPEHPVQAANVSRPQ